MSESTAIWVVCGLGVAGVAAYYFWPKSTPTLTAQPGDTVVGVTPTASNPNGMTPVVVGQYQTRLNTIAAKQGWNSVTVNGIINDPTFTSVLQQFQTWFNQTYTAAQASISALPNTNGILDANTGGALIYVYNLDTASTPLPTLPSA